MRFKLWTFSFSFSLPRVQLNCFPSVALADKAAYADADLQGSSSDSEDEVMGQYQEAVSRSQGLRGAARMVGSIKQAAGFSWESRHHKYSPLGADYAGYSSEASADDGRLSGSSGGWAGEGGRLQKKTHARKKKPQQ